MKKFLIVAMVTSLPLISFSQDAVSLSKKIDDLTYGWDLEADNLDDYDGLR